MPTGVLHLKEVDTDEITLDGTLSVSGASTLEGATVAHSTLSVGGAATLADANAANVNAANVNVSGTLSVAGQTTMGGNIIPDTNDAYDIGSPEFKIRDLYVSDNSIWVGDDMKISNDGGKLKFRKRKTNVVPRAILDAGANAGHANEQATADAALAHAGVANVSDMKLQHWFKFMRTLNSLAKITDIFRDTDDDYEESSASDAWKEISGTNKIYTNSVVGVGTSDPDDTLHVKGSFKVESDTGFQLIRSTVGADDPQLIIDTKQFGVDETIEDLTGQGLSKFTKLYRVYGTNSEGYGRDWYWGLANDDYTNISLAVGGESGGNDPDLAFTFTTASELHCNKVYAALGGNADTATRLATPRKINGVDFDGTQDITIDTGSDGVDGITSLNGNIGIGTTSDPKQKLQVNGNVYFTGTEPGNVLHGDKKLALQSDSTVLIVCDTNDTTGDGSGGDIIFGSGTPYDTNTNKDFTWSQLYPTGAMKPRNERMRIKGSGNVGIGTTTPGSLLSVESTNGNHLRLNYDPDWYNVIERDSAGKLNFKGRDGPGAALNTYMTMVPYTGNVGIGTTNPLDGLHTNTMRVGNWNGGGNGFKFSMDDNAHLRIQYMAGTTVHSHVMSMDYHTGRVGIGATNPVHKLHIYDNSSDPLYLKIQAEASNRAGIILSEDSADHAVIEYDGTGTDAENYLAFCSGIPGWTARGDGLNFIPSNGRVGIGTSSPIAKLHVKSADREALHIQKTSNADGVGISFSDLTDNSQNGFLTYYHRDTQSYGTGNMFKFSTDQGSETFAVGGTLMIGVDGKDAGQFGTSGNQARQQIFIQATYGGNTSASYGWWIGTQNEGNLDSDNDLYFGAKEGSAQHVNGWILDQAFTQMNFTGQHRTFVRGMPANKIEGNEGLIVCADLNEFIRMSGGVACGNEAITINESLPLVSLSRKAKDKKCFGVLSASEDPDKRVEYNGNFASLMRKEEGDTRVYVNSVGEGGVWVINTNGSLESGDYITTSEVPGYGMKQDDDLLHNYTVAKTLMDCDFNPKIQKKKKILKELKSIDCWARYRNAKITAGEYEELPDNERLHKDGEYFKVIEEELLKKDPYNEDFVHEKRDEWKNVLDVNGELQWEMEEEEEKAYKIRYLDAKGHITTKENAVHVAAFVGCTYHCG